MEAAKDLIAREAYVIHGDPPERIAAKVADMKARRQPLAPHAAPLLFGVSGYVVCRDGEGEARRELARVTDVRVIDCWFSVRSPLVRLV